jgi:hypothetical protein
VRHENNIETNMTGITAFLSNDTFLKTSYEPNNIAEIKAKNNHIKDLQFNYLQFLKNGICGFLQE